MSGGGFPIESGQFHMDGLQQPKRKPGTFSDQQSTKISQNLAMVGLSCSANTPDKVHGYASDILQTIAGAQDPKGTQVHITAPADQSKDYQYTVDNTNKAFSMMSQLLANLDKLSAGDVYYVATNHVSNTFKSTTIGGIKEAFSAIGKVVGSVQNGHIEAGQLASSIGDVIATLTDTSSNDFNQEDSQILFCIVKPTSGSKVSPAICGVKYSYKMTVHDVKNKKEKTHDASYTVDQSNIVFTDEKVFQEVYDKIMK